MNVQDSAFAADDEYKMYDKRSYYYEENPNTQLLTLRNGGFSQRMKNNAIYYLDALQREGEGAKDAIEMFKNSMKHINKSSIDNPLYGILNSQQNRQEIDPVIQYLAKVADICYMAARQYSKKIEQCEKIFTICEEFTSKRVSAIVGSISPADAKVGEKKIDIVTSAILSNVTIPTITAEQNADVNSAIVALTEGKNITGGVNDKVKDTLAYSVSPIALINKTRKTRDNNLLDILLDILKK